MFKVHFPFGISGEEMACLTQSNVTMIKYGACLCCILKAWFSGSFIFLECSTLNSGVCYVTEQHLGDLCLVLKRNNLTVNDILLKKEFFVRITTEFGTLNNPFQAIVSFLYPLKTPENHSFSKVFWGYGEKN